MPLVKTRGKIFAARARSRLADFCEKLTFRENFSQKNFLKKFSNFPKKRLTKLFVYGIIEENQGGRPMTYDETVFLLLGIQLLKIGSLTEEQKEKFFEESLKIIEKMLDKSNQM